MNTDQQPAAADFEIGFREPGRRAGLVLLWPMLIGGSVWLFVVTPHDLATVLMLVGFVVACIATLVWRTYLTIRPRSVTISENGIAIRFPEWRTHIRWHEIEGIELQELQPSAREHRLLRIALQPGARFVRIRLRRRYGLRRWLKVPFVALPLSRTAIVPLVEAPRFVAMANERLAGRP